MAEVVKNQREQAMRIAVLISITLVTFNAGFFYLSKLWFEDSKLAYQLGSVRVAFGVMTAIIAAASFTAALAPRQIGHGLAMVLGLGSIVAGFAALAHGMPGVMGVTLLVVGGLMPVLAWFSLRHSRGAWAFLIALLAVFGAVTLFGAPKVRGILGIGLWSALIVPGLLAVGTIALSMLRDQYRERV